MAVALLFTGYYRHPKMMSANAAAGAGFVAEVLFTRALDYCAEHGTDGHLSPGVPDQLLGRRASRAVKALVAAGLWEVDAERGGHLVHDYLEWNRTAADLARRSETKRRAGKKGAQVRWGGRLAKPGGEEAPAKADAMAEPMADAMADPSQSYSPGSGPGPSSLRSDPPGGRLPPPAGEGQASPPTAQTLLAEHVDTCRRRPPGQVIGMLGRQLKSLLEEGFDPDDVRAGLAIVREKGLSPTALPSCVDQVINQPKRGGAAALDTSTVDYSQVRL